MTAIPKTMQLFRQIWRRLIIAIIAVALCTACQSASNLDTLTWEPVQLPTDATPLDISFTSKEHGWLVGSESTLLETFDGGKTWEPRSLELGGIEHRLTSVSFAGQEGWIVGEPTLLVHTTDGGKTWTSITLSNQLPGTPRLIAALGAKSAEMTTDQGAIYATQDSGQHWQAKVLESFGVTRNIRRSEDGQYVAVSERGNYFSIWKPGLKAWEPYNRNNSRKLQRMGFDPDGQLWMISRGGQLQFSDGDPFGGQEEWADPIKPKSGGMGLLDLAYRTPNEIWTAGGSATLLRSDDGGKTWQQDRTVTNIPSSFFKIIFLSPDQGFITGQSGTLLRYIGEATPTA